MFRSKLAQVRWRTVALTVALLATFSLWSSRGWTEQPPPPCHPNPNAAADQAQVANRGDVASLPMPLRSQLVRMASRPHSTLPIQAYAEADSPSQLFQYYLLDSDNFEPNPFSAS